MDSLDVLAIRFHYGGEFVKNNDLLQYIGGHVALSEVNLDLLSRPEIVGHLEDHWKGFDKDNVQLHWLIPGKELYNGLGLLHDDVAVQRMASNICEGGVADIYVESISRQTVTHQDHMQVDNSFEEDLYMLTSASEEGCRGVFTIRSPVKCKPRRAASTSGDLETVPVGEQMPVAVSEETEFQASAAVADTHMFDSGSDEEDSDYCPDEEDASEEDEEAEQIKKTYAEYKKKNQKRGDTDSRSSIF